MQPGDEGLLQLHQHVPGPELAAVRVAGELDVKARIGRRLRAVRLVLEKHA